MKHPQLSGIVPQSVHFFSVGSTASSLTIFTLRVTIDSPIPSPQDSPFSPRDYVGKKGSAEVLPPGLRP